MESIETRLRDVVRDTLGVVGFVPQARFAEHLNADSLDIVDLTMAVEDEFRIEIRDDEGDALLEGSFADLLALVEAKLGEKVDG